ncbi:MAG TPA: transposase, partial [bacterium]|nr:transposase [bacterium]
MRKAFKFRLYPNNNQRRELNTMLETHRRLYNVCLEQRKIAYNEDGISIGFYEQSPWYTNQRKTNKWFANINFSSAQGTMWRLHRAYQAFFRRVKAGEKPGYPRFKAQGRFLSVEFPSYRDGVRLMPDGKLRVQHIGKLKVKQHRAIAGKIKTVTLKVENDKWFAVFSCDLGEIKVEPSKNPPIGIDVGIESFYTTS